MINPRYCHHILLVLLCLTGRYAVLSQPTLTAADLKKPAKYENRVLKAETTGEKKFTLPRRLTQNTYTHYNYAFNAQFKLDRVLSIAKSQHVDNFNAPLSFYNYDLETTAAQKKELDSVIYKVNAGIFLHDLRNNWIDNLYLQLGQAYYLRNSLDSAYLTFQYMNFAFAPKDEQGYDLYIASNSNEGGNNLKVSTVEKRTIIQRSFSEPPSRNDALIWLIRTHISQKNYVTAFTLIQTLRNDPDFPQRLQTALAEVTAYYFYQQPQYDSTAYYLEKALPNAGNREEQARWEFLLGQLYARIGKRDAAKEAYQRSMKHTLNPIMEVAAQLQATQQFDTGNELDWQTAIAALEKMARKERYANNRDLIYYTLAQIEASRQRYTPAHQHLLKSIRNAFDNPEQKSKSYLLMAEIAFAQKRYLDARYAYDSVDGNYLTEQEVKDFTPRKQALAVIGTQLMVMRRQDSVQQLAALPEAERNAYLKKTLRSLRRQQGLAEEEAMGDNNQNPLLNNASGAQQQADLFSGSAGNATEFYFYNSTLKARGFNEFRSKWGNRQNVDNWRRLSAAGMPGRQQVPEAGATGNRSSDAGNTLSMESLLAGIPLTPEKMQASNDSIRQARYLLALALQNKLEDYAGAATEYETLLEKFPGDKKEAEILYNLAICYQHLGREQDFARVRGSLKAQYPNSRQARIASDPLAVRDADSALAKKATAQYNTVYDLFLEGQFDSAMVLKKQADSLFGNQHWTPQLLYIEAIYQVKKKEDSAAVETLNAISDMFSEHPLAQKAATMIDVLKRRKQIEAYLTNLQVERPAGDSTLASPSEQPNTVTPRVTPSR
ncbi:MAG: tetratricopeptide repeat protein [Flavihumibacter sp.]